ncbi:myocardin-related transcription factor A isoform X2 [Pseudophryne corroboree]|uniref:myocardin-related transcription factor A isoform X2 n=1 Tax=Pseudophryne corroboree TaxID=495146 RepID=UPI0030818F11
MKNIVDYTNLSRLLPPSSSQGGHGRGGYKGGDDEALTMEGPPAPSPQSEAVANDLQELSLQPGSYIQVAGHRSNDPPLSERKNVLQLKLQQRRTREELVNQGIMPPLKSPASFHEQRRSLERARTEDYLKRKIRCRPQRSELVRMHILEETSAEPSLQAKQLKLKRARLADDLNEKISQRPGPMELVVKNILPVETSLKEVIIDVDYAKVADSSSFDEDSSDALSPEQPASQESQGSVPSPADSRVSEATPLLSPTQTFTWVQLGSDIAEKPHASELPQTMTLNISNGLSAPANKSFPSFIKNNQSKPFHDKSQRSKKTKEPKPRVKKLKYHQYIPPDQKQKGTPAMDSSYAKILQQQQLFLQLQILNQQQHQHYNYQTILPAPPKPLQDQQTTAITNITTVRTLPTISVSTHAAPNVFRQNSNMAAVPTKMGPLPYNLDDLKVAELKQELKQRGLHVSGTKLDLIERLKATQDPCTVTSGPIKSTSNQQLKPSEVMPAIPTVSAFSSAKESSKLGSFSSTPPCSPCPSEVSIASMDDVSTIGDPFTETSSSSVAQRIVLSSSAPNTNEKCSTIVRDKDIMLREKDRQIEALTRRLKQKQDLVERLRQQIEHEKKTQPLPPCDDQQSLISQVKQEPNSFTCDSIKSMQSLDTRAAVKSELVTHATCQQEQQMFINSVLKRDEVKINGSTGPQLILTVHNPSAVFPETLTTTQESPQPNILQPKTQILLPQTSPQSPKPGLQLGPCTILSFAISSNIEPFVNVNGLQKQQTDMSKECPISCTEKQVVSPNTQSPTTTATSQSESVPSQNIFLSPSSPAWTKETPENGEPNSSEDGRPTGLQMDDFFDILIHNLDLTTECKEYLVPCLKQTSPTPAENAVPQSEMPPPPVRTAPDRLEDFSETSIWTQLLRAEQDGTSVPLIDDLHSQMLSSLAILDHPSSPMDTSDLHFSPERDSLGLDMSDPPLNGMDWLELLGPPAMNLTPLSTATPSVFSTDFLDSHDMQLHWDSSL